MTVTRPFYSKECSFIVYVGSYKHFKVTKTIRSYFGGNGNLVGTN